MDRPQARGTSRVTGLWRPAGQAARLDRRGQPASSPRLSCEYPDERGHGGHCWDGTADFRTTPPQYEALAFHSDDPARRRKWQTHSHCPAAVSLDSGVYAAKTVGSRGRPLRTLLCRAAKGAARHRIGSPHADLHLSGLRQRSKVREGVSHFDGIRSWPARHGPGKSRHRDFGLSLYDRHADLVTG